VFDTCYNPGSEWTHYGVPLHELAGWRRDSLADPAATSEDMLTVLSSLSELRIRADYHTLHADDYWGLDNVAMMACDVASIYAWGMENPMELAFDSDGYLYAGHSRNASRLSIYQIPPGGGQAVEYGQGAFSDPDGLDCDGADTVWIASGLWANVQDGEVKEIAANGTVSNVGTNYLTNPMSLEVDRSGRFGPEGSLIVANQRSGLGVEIFSVTPTAGGGADVTNVPPSLTDLVVAEDLSFDAEDTLWFVGNGQLYRWLDTPGAQPEPVPLPGVNGLLSAVGFDPYTETLVVGLADERRIIRVSLEGEVGEELAGCLDPQSFAFDAAGNIFVSDSVRDVIWRIGVHDVPEPPTLALLGIAVLGLFVYRRRTPCLCSTQLSGSCRKSPDSAGKSLKGYH